MAHLVRPPYELSSTGSMDTNRRNWKKHFIIYLKLSGMANKPEDYKISLLMKLIGPIGQQAFQNFTFDSPNDNENMEIILRKFDDHYDPKKTKLNGKTI